MIPGSFDYVAPSSVEQAVKVLEHERSARVLAGGLSLLRSMKLRRVAPSVLVDLNKIDELSGIKREKKGGALRIGAMTHYGDIAASGEVIGGYRALAEAADCIGDAQVRNQGTIGGSLSYNDPAADLPAVALALEALIHTVNPEGTRVIPMNEFNSGAFKTNLRPAEIVTSAEFPALSPRTGSGYEKIRDPASGFAICGVAAMVRLQPDGTVAVCRVAVTGAADHAVRLGKIEAAIENHIPTEERLAEAAACISEEGLVFRSDLAASAEYRGHLARVLVERALTRAVHRAKSG